MSLFSRKKKAEPGAANFGMQGQPLHVNPSPGSKQSIQRHLSRMLTCLDSMAKHKGDQERIDSLQAEIDRRAMQMQIAGYPVPDGRADIEEMLKRYGG